MEKKINFVRLVICLGESMRFSRHNFFLFLSFFIYLQNETIKGLLSTLGNKLMRNDNGQKRANFGDMLTKKKRKKNVILIIETVFFSLFLIERQEKNGLKLLVFQSITVSFLRILMSNLFFFD